MKTKLSLISLAFVVFVTGCGGNKYPGSTDPSQVSEKKQSYDFVLVCPTTNNGNWEESMRGIQKADEELGTVTEAVGSVSSDNSSVGIIEQMEQAIESMPDGIIAYAGIADMAPLIDRAASQGIPVLTIGSDAPGTGRIAYIGTDLYSLGYQSGETLLRLTGGQARIGYLCSTFSEENEKKVFDGFQDAIANYDMKVAAKGEGHAEPDYAAEAVEAMLAAAEAVEAMLAEHPEITVIFCTGDYSITGAARAKQKLGLDGLMLFGFDDVEENLDYVREGVIDALLVQSPYQMGYQSVYLMKEYLDTGSLDRENYDTGSILVTRENVDGYKD